MSTFGEQVQPVNCGTLEAYPFSQENSCLPVTGISEHIPGIHIYDFSLRTKIMNAEDIPIDIHYNKLLDWLISRRHCQLQWQKAALIIREKINTAIQDMPPVDEITQLLRGTYINYFHCLKIVSLLKETEDGSKNIFGWYSSQRMKDWMDIIKCYEKDGVYLAEAAQMLMRNVNYEIPALKRQVAKYQQIQKDCTRKQSEYASLASQVKERYLSSCKQIGIKGEKVKTELVALVKDMSSLYAEIERSAKKLKPATQYYATFVNFILNRSNKSSERLQLLKYFIDVGNCTTYEWKHGKAPTSIIEPVRDYGVEEEEKTEEADEIDWGDLDAGADAINFDISIEDSGMINAEGSAEVNPENQQDSAGDGIVTEIEIVDNGTDSIATEEGVAKGTEALTLLDNSQTRNILINDLLELEAFFAQRVHELSNESSILTVSQFSSAPDEIQLDADVLKAMLSDIRELIAYLTSKKMQNLFLIRSSPSYVHRTADSLIKILNESEKMLSLSKLMTTKYEEAIEEERKIQPKIELLRKRTHELKKQVEGDISKKYKDRRVNIMGEINTI